MQPLTADLPGKADIVIGIPSFNNSRTIGHVVRAAHAGLAKYFPQFNAVIVNSDGGSTDGTRDSVLSARVEDLHLLLLDTPLKAVHRLSLPYHGIPGKGSAFRLIFQIAEKTGAKACAVVDSDLRSITPEWIDLLVRPVLLGGYDFVAPYYHRHKYDGTITNSIVYPLTRAMYGKRIRQPIGGDFGVSPSLLHRYLARDDWETDVGRFGIDIWMTTIAVAEGFRVCQSFLGAKLHDAKDPGADLSAMLQQVVGSVFGLMGQYQQQWRQVKGSEAVDLFGFRFDVGLEPVAVNVERMLRIFRQGCQDLREVWATAMGPGTLDSVLRVSSLTGAEFHLPDETWVRVIYEFAVAFQRHRVERQTLIRSLTPLYIGRVASFVNETSDLNSDQVEERMERLCQCFEDSKPYLMDLWDGHAPAAAAPETPAAHTEELYAQNAPGNS